MDGLNIDQLRERTWRDVRDLGGQHALADRVGISRPHLSDFLRGNRGPPRLLLEYFGLREQVLYIADGPEERAP